MESGEVILIPSPGIGQLVPAVQLAKLITEKDERLSATIFIMKLPFDQRIDTYTDSLATSSVKGGLRFICLPHQRPSPGGNFLSSVIQLQKPHVRAAVTELTRSKSKPIRFAGFIIGMFCTAMIDVANEFSAPTYVFYTSSAAALGLLLHLQTLRDGHGQDITELKDSDISLAVPSCMNPVPAKVLPSVVLSRDWSNVLLDQFKRFKETRGIVVNTFLELEHYAVNSIASEGNPEVYTVGPVLDLKGDAHVGSCGSQQYEDLMTWLDNQPVSSVAFLCFGSMGSFGEDQVREIARALEQGKHRFLWSLRQPPPKGKMGYPSEYPSLRQALPEGFLARTAAIGRVIGWAPQVAALAHPAVGGFVSHCGWNSILESLWFGVPIAAWPMYSEQQFNAFEMLRELGLAVEVKMDYKRDIGGEQGEVVVPSEEIDRAIKVLMESETGEELRRKVKEMKEKCRVVVEEGGSSYCSLSNLVGKLLENR